MGEMEVPADALYGASTQRAVLNFPISGERMPRRFLRALALIKLAAAQTNAELGLLDADVAAAIAAAAASVADGDHDEQFPIDIYQTGSAHLDQHQHERGRRPPRGEASRRGPEGPPERRGQPLPELERRHPDSPPAVGRDGDRGGPATRPRAAAHRARGQGAGLLAGGQDRPDTPPGRDPDPARAGIPWLRRAGRGVDPARANGTGRAARGPARRDGRRDRHQRPSRVRIPDVHPAVRPDRADRPRDRRTTSTPRRRWMRPSPHTARSGRSRSACGRSPRTSG